MRRIHMTIQRDAVVGSTTAMDSEFDLDISIVESSPVVAELLQDTSDNCGQTCESACSDSCP
ncbi:MAG: FxLD family lanthipeptide [Pseudonocardiaceae bacterium]